MRESRVPSPQPVPEAQLCVAPPTAKAGRSLKSFEQLSEPFFSLASFSGFQSGAFRGGFSGKQHKDTLKSLWKVAF